MDCLKNKKVRKIYQSMKNILNEKLVTNVINIVL